MRAVEDGARLVTGAATDGAVEKIVKRLARLAILCGLDAPADFIEAEGELVAQARAEGGEAAWAAAQALAPVAVERERLRQEGASALFERCFCECVNGAEETEELVVGEPGPEGRWCRNYSLTDAPGLAGRTCTKFRRRM